MTTKPAKLYLVTIILLLLAITLSACSEEQKNNQDNKSKQVKQNKGQDNKQAQTTVLFKQLLVAEEVTAEYNRDDFEHWSDLDGNGCDTREDVLYRENLEKEGDCSNASGKWFSAYDQETTTDSSGFDVDHMIPLSEAWDSGADQWTDQKREAFANDIYPYSLIAVSASSNRSKSDQDPAQWMPESQEFTCSYLARWVAVKARWQLTIDTDEQQALNSLLSSCSAKQLKLNAPLVIQVNKNNSKNNQKQTKPNKQNNQKKNQKQKSSQKKGSGKTDPKFASCSEAVSKGYGNYRKGEDKEYNWYGDSDNDGTVCEK